MNVIEMRRSFWARTSRQNAIDMNSVARNEKIFFRWGNRLTEPTPSRTVAACGGCCSCNCPPDTPRRPPSNTSARRRC